MFGIKDFCTSLSTTELLWLAEHCVQLSIFAGVSQGSVPGPKLFHAYLVDLPTTRGIKILQFADDILIYIAHSAPLASSRLVNRFLGELVSYYED